VADAGADALDDTGGFAAGNERQRRAHLIFAGGEQGVDIGHGGGANRIAHLTGPGLARVVFDQAIIFRRAQLISDHGARHCGRIHQGRSPGWKTCWRMA
jgi:hypothetical protein